jgi:phosphate uptake regulator
MQIRKIFKIGRKSYVVTLPKDWVEKLQSPEVAMVYNSILLVLPKNKQNSVDKAMEQAIKQIVQG